MSSDGRGEIIKLKLLYYIYHVSLDRNKPLISVSKRRLRRIYNGRFLDQYLEELIDKHYIRVEKVQQKGKELYDLANYYFIDTKGLEFMSLASDHLTHFFYSLQDL
ncbi:MAG: hypothetical protein IH840_16785 [Candidatus Heimdallarchaeota archaeon]|nr:hypothetical protein [Candidatus Heimdallarchaeota archaeon]